MAIICDILRFLGKEFLDRSLIQQRSTQNSQHFVGTPVQFEVVLNDSHHAICGDKSSLADRVRHAVRNTFITKHLVNLFIKNMSAHDENAG